jgi:predicted DNA-binding protein
MDSKNKVVKMSVNLSEEAVEALKNMAAERGVTVTEVLRHAIGLEKYVDQVQKDQGKILVETSKGQVRELVFR